MGDLPVAPAAAENPFADLIPTASSAANKPAAENPFTDLIPRTRTYTIELPDGRIMTAEANSEEEALAGAKAWWAEQQQQSAGEPIFVELPDGRKVEFPAGTPREVMEAALRKHFGPADGARGARAAADLQGYREPRHGFSGWLKDQADIVAPIAQGATANFAEELAATSGAAGNWLFRQLGMDVPELDRAQILRNIRRRQDEFAADNPKTATAGEIIGSLAPAVGGGIAAARALPTISGRIAQLPGIVRAGIAGGAGGAGYESVNRMGELREPAGIGDFASAASEGAMEGGIGGLVAGPAAYLAGNAVARVVGPWATAAAQRLHDRGIRLTPGQLVGGSDGNILGRGIGALEQASSSIPLANMLVRQQYRRAVDDLNRVAVNEVLAPIGQQLPRGVRPGREAIQSAHEAISDAYEQVVPYLRADWSAPAVSTELARIRARVPQDLQGRFDDAVNRYLGRVANPMNGQLAGRDVQNALAGLSRDARGYAANPSSLPHDRDLGEALGDVRELLIDSIRTTTPGDVWSAFRNTQRAFERLARVEQAATSTASKQGVFGPSQLQQAVRSTDRSARRSRFARGQAPFQDISDDAATVMSRDLADSGSAERIGVMSALTYGPSAATMNPWLLAGPGAVATAYTSPAQWLARKVIAGGGRSRNVLRRAIERATHYGASGTGAAAGDELRDGGVAMKSAKLQRAINKARTVTGGIRGKTGGREDKLPVDVVAGSYIVPADVVAALGSGNTEAGIHMLDQQFPTSQARAAGGRTEAVPIRISDGEYVLSPDAVTRAGGHDRLDRLVTRARAAYAEHLAALPPPNGSDAAAASSAHPAYRAGGRIDGRLQRSLDRARSRLPEGERGGFDAMVEKHLYAPSDRKSGRISAAALDKADAALPPSARDAVRQMRRRYGR